MPRPRLVPGTQFAPTREIMTAEKGTPGGILEGLKALMMQGEKEDEKEEMSEVDEGTKTEDDILIQMFDDARRTKSTEEVMEMFGPEGTYRREAERAFSNKGLNINDYLSPTQKAEGGLINLAAGGEFSGMVPGRGGGMDDNVFMPIKEGNKQVGTLAVSPTEYVVDSYTMAALGDGNPSEGAKVMDGVVKGVRQKAYGTMKQPNEIDGLRALRPMMEGV